MEKLISQAINVAKGVLSSPGIRTDIRKDALELLETAQNCRSNMIEVGGYYFSQENYKDICSLLAQGRKISAIRIVNTVTDMGLIKAKDFVEGYF